MRARTRRARALVDLSLGVLYWGRPQHRCSAPGCATGGRPQYCLLPELAQRARAPRAGAFPVWASHRYEVRARTRRARALVDLPVGVLYWGRPQHRCSAPGPAAWARHWSPARRVPPSTAAPREGVYFRFRRVCAQNFLGTVTFTCAPARRSKSRVTASCERGGCGKSVISREAVILFFGFEK